MLPSSTLNVNNKMFNIVWNVLEAWKYWKQIRVTKTRIV